MTIFGISALALSAILIPFIGGFLIVVCPQPFARAISVAAGALATVLTIAVWLGFASSGEERLMAGLAAVGAAIATTAVGQDWAQQLWNVLR